MMSLLFGGGVDGVDVNEVVVATAVDNDNTDVGPSAHRRWEGSIYLPSTGPVRTYLMNAMIASSMMTTTWGGMDDDDGGSTLPTGMAPLEGGFENAGPRHKSAGDVPT